MLLHDSLTYRLCIPLLPPGCASLRLPQLSDVKTCAGRDPQHTSPIQEHIWRRSISGDDVRSAVLRN